MIGSKSRFRRICLVCIFVFGAGEVAAQQAPIRLLPPTDSSQTPSAGDISSPRRKAVDLVPAHKPPRSLVDAIRIENLTGYSTGTLGPLSPGRGGFNDKLWAGVEMSRIETLFKQMPTDWPLPGLHSLYRRLLLSASVAPDGGGDTRFLALRLQRLADAGMLAGLESLLKLLPDSVADPAILKWKLTAGLLRGDLDAGCVLARRMVSAHDDPVWLQAKAFCEATAGDRAGAELSLQLLTELGHGDPIFNQLVGAVLGRGNGGGPGLERLTPLQIAMLRRAGYPINQVQLLNSPKLVQRAAVDMQEIPVEIRVEIATGLFDAGLLQAAPLRRLYGEITLPAEALDNARQTISTGSVEAVAALLQASFRSSAQQDRLQMLSDALIHADSPVEFRRRAALFAPLLASLDAVTVCDKVSGDIALILSKALIVAGRFDSAKTWYLRCLQPTSRAGPQDRAAAFWPWVRTAQLAGAGPANREWLARWWDYQAARTPDLPEEARNQQLILLHILDGLHIPTEARYWTELLQNVVHENARQPSASSAPRDTRILNRTGLARAIATGHTGEALLHLLLLLGRAATDGVNPADIRESLLALKQLELPEEAHRLAGELMAAHGY